MFRLLGQPCLQARCTATLELLNRAPSLICRHDMPFQYQQVRFLAAFDPKWRPKAPRPWKVTREKKKDKKLEPIRRKMKAAKEHQREQRRLLREANVVPPVTRPAVDNTNELKDMRVFHASSSPFVFLASKKDADSMLGRYWEKGSHHKRSPLRFAFLPPHPNSRHFAPWSAANEEALPSLVGEVAFLGRSNVGKSSLMNALMGANLARTSKLPGRTQKVMYYGMYDQNDQQQHARWDRASAFFVDLPGYGYAVGPDEAVDSWQARTQNYLLARMETEQLKQLYVLVDSRHPQQDLDWTIFKWLDDVALDIPYTVVLTKADGLAQGPKELIPHLNSIAMRYLHKFRQDFQRQYENPFGVDDDHVQSIRRSVATRLNAVEQDPLSMRRGGQCPVIHITSATKNMGLNELWSSISFHLKS